MLEAPNGEEMLLLPKFGGGWTECQVAELTNGSVLMEDTLIVDEKKYEGLEVAV